MIRPILLALFAFILLALIAIWIMSGGPRSVITATKDSFRSAVVTDEGAMQGFRLPWQPVQIFPSIDLTELTGVPIEGTEDDGAASSGEWGKTTAERLGELEAEYDRLRGRAAERPLGTPSPYAGKIALAADYGVRASDPREETVQIVASYTNEAPINISGWTLQSALTTSSVQIPLAASPFVQGGGNSVGSVALNPGALAIVVSGPSPVGLSFRENMCVGYLQQYQPFVPPLIEECPSASSILPFTERTLQQYGEGCFDALSYVSQCRFPQNLPANVTPACRGFLTDALSYNGCVRDNRFRAEFQKDSWRLFLGSGRELWGNGHDAIRLLDGEGRTVSVFVY